VAALVVEVVAAAVAEVAAAAEVAAEAAAVATAKIEVEVLCLQIGLAGVADVLKEAIAPSVKNYRASRNHSLQGRLPGKLI